MALGGATVCVTGAGGFIASWLVKDLLARGCTVHGTVRDPDAAKNAHLKKLPHAGESLKLFKADLLDYSSLEAAVAGCRCVFHVASPVIFHKVQSPQEEIISPAVTGTMNVLTACNESNVRRVVVVSSTGAVTGNPSFRDGRVLDEEFWSDEEFCRSAESWYAYAKTLAERAALDFGKNTGLQVVTACPSYVLGPMLQPEVNSSSSILLGFLRDPSDAAANELKKLAFGIVDVRDVVDALILLGESDGAAGRYICSASRAKVQEIADKLLNLYPGYTFLKSFDWSSGIEVVLSSKKLEALGWKSRTIDDILKDSVDSYRTAGLL